MLDQKIFLVPPADLTLQNNDVHIWGAAFQELASQVEPLAQILSPDEKKRAKRFYFEQDKINFIIGRGLLRIILGRYLAIAPDSLQFNYNPYGKPALASLQAGHTIQFNLSHSQDMVLYAFTRDRQIGIDLEYLRPIPELEQIMQQFFSANETAALNLLPTHKKQRAFFQIWTCKEAFLKATGVGLSQLTQVEVSLASKETYQLLNSNTQTLSNWSLQTLTPAQNYLATLVVEGHDWMLHCWQWTN